MVLQTCRTGCAKTKASRKLEIEIIVVAWGASICFNKAVITGINSLACFVALSVVSVAVSPLRRSSETGPYSSNLMKTNGKP